MKKVLWIVGVGLSVILFLVFGFANFNFAGIGYLIGYMIGTAFKVALVVAPVLLVLWLIMRGKKK